MKVAFWNVQRCGVGSPDEKKMFLGDVVEYLYYQGAQFIVMCEVTSDTDIFTSEASYGIPIKKILAKNKQKKKKTSAQLGYGIISDVDINSFNEQINDYDDVFNMPTYKKTGNKFNQKSKRCVLSIPGQNGFDFYFYHANAVSGTSEYLVSWVAEHLRMKDNHPFVLIGDFNCSPTTLAAELQKYDLVNGGSLRNEFNIAFGTHTHPAHNPTITYDYAIGRATSNIDVETQDTYFNELDKKYQPDHLPIIVDIT